MRGAGWAECFFCGQARQVPEVLELARIRFPIGSRFMKGLGFRVQALEVQGSCKSLNQPRQDAAKEVALALPGAAGIQGLEAPAKFVIFYPFLSKIIVPKGAIVLPSIPKCSV